MKLNNGILIPEIGLGTFRIEPEDAYNSVRHALSIGYRLIDTANFYVNEKAVGRAIKDSNISREEIFLSTKIWPTEYENNSAIDVTLERIGVEYIDLLFLHQPTGNYIKAYKLIEEYVKKGKVKAIGLSNFEADTLDEILKVATIPPQVIQLEAHPYFTQKEYKKTLNKYGIVIMSWFPLGHGDKNLINEKIFTDLGKKYNKTNAQIILRWHIQMGYIIIPGSKNKDHIKENLEITDFKLTDDEMLEISKLDKNEKYVKLDKDRLKGYLQMFPKYED